MKMNVFAYVWHWGKMRKRLKLLALKKTKLLEQGQFINNRTTALDNRHIKRRVVVPEEVKI